MSFFTRTYPFMQSGHWLRDCVLYGVGIWAILYLLQPFGFSNYQGNKFLTAVIFGLVTWGCCVLYNWGVFNRLPQRVQPWRVWHHGCALLGLVLFIAVCNFLTFSLFFHIPVTLEAFLLFLNWTLVIGLFMSAVSVIVGYNRFLKEKMEALLSNTAEEQKDICITIHDTNVRGNDLTVPINDLLYVEAQKNNVSVCYLKDNKAVCTELHTTLSAVVEELKDYENIFQCHRSFVVNVNNITSAKGNSNGYQLTLRTCSENVPVSRSYVPRLKAFIA